MKYDHLYNQSIPNAMYIQSGAANLFSSCSVNHQIFQNIMAVPELMTFTAQQSCLSKGKEKRITVARQDMEKPGY